MIVKISNGLRGYHGIINYHDKKVQEGRGEVITSSFGYIKKTEVINYFKDIAKMNKSVKNKGHDIPFSFNYADKISDDKFKIIANDYLNEMGFSGHPYIIYKHNDKEHQHYHVVVSNVDDLGKFNNRMRSFYKKDSQRLSRELEVKYDLVVTEYNRKEKSESLRLVNATKYSLQKTIIKALDDETLRPILSEHTKDIESLLFKEDLNNEHLEALLGSSYEPILKLLENTGTLKKTYKSQLLDILEQGLEKSNSVNQYEDLIKNAGLYVRFVKGKNQYVYGIKDQEKDIFYYYNEDKLPERFSAKNLYHGPEIKNVSDKQQKQYIKSIVNKAIKQSDSIDNFSKFLKNRNIETLFHKNAAGIYGVSFTTLNVTNSNTFKASEVNRDLSWNKIVQQLESNTKIDKEYHFEDNDSLNAQEDNSLQLNNFIPNVTNYDTKRNKHEDEELHTKNKRNKNLKR